MIKKYISIVVLLLLILNFISCNKTTNLESVSKVENQIEFAKGFELYDFDEFKLLKINNTSPTSIKSQTYLLHKKGALIPDSLQHLSKIIIPLNSIVVTSTTHLPSLEALEVENTLVGFPGLNYISSNKIHHLIEQGNIKEIGENESINTEMVIDLSPDLLVSFAINESNQTLENIKQAGINVVLNGDWNEKLPLGKAEWIKFFGALYDKDAQAKEYFGAIVSEYQNAIKIASTAKNRPTIITGNVFEDVWYLPKGNSWNAELFKDANTEYFWKNSSGTGSLALSIEQVLDTAQMSDYWIGAGYYASLEEMKKANLHYAAFKSFNEGNVYSYTTKKGVTGGVVYFELASNRPDLVLKDIIKITHPELLENYELQFFEKLK